MLDQSPLCTLGDRLLIGLQPKILVSDALWPFDEHNPTGTCVDEQTQLVVPFHWFGHLLKQLFIGIE